VVGFDPRSPGFFWLAGQGGYGIQTSPAMARLASRLCLGEAPPAALGHLVAALAPGRLAH
jgi:D-arginine dehydrogenase